MRRPITIWLLGLCLLALFAAAQAKALVWRVEGAHNRVYLAGAMHFLPERAYPLPDAYATAYAAAQSLALEVDQAKLARPAVVQRMRSAARYARGDLQSYIGSRLYQRVKKAIADTDLSMRRIDRFRPWFVATALEAAAYRDAGFQPALGLDRHFFQRARADAKPILPLTPIAAHLAVFTAMPAKLSRDLLTSTLDNADGLASASRQVYAYWAHGNAAGLAASVRAQASAYPALYDRLIYDRNDRWLPEIESLLDSAGDVMVVVGAVHLVGKRGLVARLRRAGYAVTRVD